MANADYSANWVVTVEFIVHAQFATEFMERLTVQATDSLREPGCLQFDICVDTSDPQRVFLYEVYLNREAFAAHLTTAHFKQFDATTRAWIRSKGVKEFRLHNVSTGCK